jgi:hypothetical protein
MTGRFPTTLVLLLLCSVTVSVNAAFDLDGWGWQARVDPGPAAEGFLRLPLTPEIFDRVRPDLADLRLLDGSGEPVPYVIHWGRTEEKQEIRWSPLTLINRTFEPGQWERVVLDFGRPVLKNRIRLALSGDGFRRRVQLEGSADDRAWEPVTEEGWVFSLRRGNEHFVADTVNFPANDFRYLRLTLFHDPDDPRRIGLEAVEGGFREPVKEPELVPVLVQSLDRSHDPERRETILLLDLGWRNLPLARLTVQPADDYYYRAYELLGRDSAVESVKRRHESGWITEEREAPWRQVGRGVLHRVHHGDRISVANTIALDRVRSRYLKLVILDQNNQPLDIESVALERREVSLVFHHRQDDEYSLIGGNSQADPPVYDMARAVQGVDEKDLPLLAAPEQLETLEQVPPVQPWTERYRVMLWGALALAVGLMLILIYRSLGRLDQA